MLRVACFKHWWLTRVPKLKPPSSLADQPTTHQPNHPCTHLGALDHGGSPKVHHLTQLLNLLLGCAVRDEKNTHVR